MQTNSPSLRRVFMEDAKLYVSNLRNLLRGLTSGKAGMESINTGFRSAHSLKSEAAFLGFDELAGIAARVESLIATIKRDSPDVQNSNLKSLGEILSKIDGALGGVESESLPKPYGRRASDRSVGPNHLGTFERQLVREAAARGESLYRFGCRIEEEAEMEQARRFLLVSNLEQKTNLIAFTPALEEDAPPEGIFEGLLSSTAGRKPIEESLSIAGIRDIHIEELSSVSLLETTPESDLVSQLATGQPALSVAIPSRRYEELLMFSSELSRLLSGLGESSEATVLRKVASIIEEYLLQSSETPAKDLFDILRPRIRKFAEGLNRSVRLETQGDSTSVFVTTAYALVDSLIQLVHNAVLHGIESPEDRRRMGKEPEGAVLVTCRRVAERLVFEVRDDGRGMTIEGLGARYRELFDRDAPQSLLSIVAEPGFSTRTTNATNGNPISDERAIRRKLTGAATEDRRSRQGPEQKGADDILGRQHVAGSGQLSDRHPTRTSLEDLNPNASGEGIGLDGVRYTVERLFGGELHVSSVKGEGTTFTLSIPATRKLLSVVIARSGERHFAVPAALVADAVPIQARLITRDRQGRRYLRHDGSNVRLYKLEDSQSIDAIDSGRFYAVLIRLGKTRAGIIVDELLSNELALLDESSMNHVFSQRVGEYVQFFVPLQLL